MVCSICVMLDFNCTSGSAQRVAKGKGWSTFIVLFSLSVFFVLFFQSYQRNIYTKLLKLPPLIEFNFFTRATDLS
jgi:hypothetical protein